MFKRISILFLVLCTLLVFTLGVGATDPGLFIEKDEGNTYIDYVDADGTSIMLIDDTDGVTIATAVIANTYTSMTVTGTADASSLTAGSIVTAGGIACAKQLYLGDDIDMSVSGTGTYDITLKANVADALSIKDSAADMIVFDTSTGAHAITITPATTITGLVTLNGGLTLGADGAGFDVIFYGDTSGSDFFWNQDGDTDASLTLGSSGGGAGVDFTIYGETNTVYLRWDRSVDDLLLVGTAVRLIISGTTDTSLTDCSVVTAGSIACTKQLWLGDDIDMTTSATGVYDITLKDTVDDALSIVGGSTDMMLFDTDTDQITFTPEILLKDDIDMQTSTTGVYDLTLKDTQADALSIVGGSTDMMVFKTNTDQIIITPEVLFADDLDLTTSATGVYDLTLADNKADALSVVNATGNDILVFDTTTSAIVMSVPIASFVMGTTGVGISVAAGSHAFAVHTEPGSALTAYSSNFGIRSRYHVDTAQTNIVTLEAVDARLRVKQNIAGGVHCGIQGYIESSGTPAFAGGLNAAGSFTLELGSGTTISGDTYMCGVSIDSASNSALTVTSTTYVGLRIWAGDGPPVKEDWEYGIIMDDGDVGVGMQIGDCTTALNLDGDMATGIALAGTYSVAAITVTSSFAAAGDYGILVTDTYTKVDGSHNAITGITIYDPAVEGYGWINAVSGKVQLKTLKEFDGGQGGLFGGQFQLDLADTCILDQENGVFAGLRGVLTGTTPTLTNFSVLACLYLDNLIAADLDSSPGEYGTAMLAIQNHGGNIDHAISVFGGANLTNFVAILGQPGFVVSGAATAATKCLTVLIGEVTYYVNLFSTAP